MESLGECQIQLGDYPLALDNLKKAIEYGPDHFTAYEQLAGVLRNHLSRPKEADQWMNRLVEANPKSGKAHLIRGNYLLTTDLRDLIKEADAEAAKAFELAPNDADVLVLAARCAIYQQRIDAARGFVERGVKLYPNNVGMCAALSDIELISGNRDKAISVLRQGLKATDRHVEILYKLVNLLIESNQLKEAGEIVAELRTKENTQPIPGYFIDYLTARINLVQKKWLAARQGFEKIRGALVQRPRLAKQVDWWIGICYGQSGDREKEIQSYRHALNIDPSFTPAREALFRTLLAMDRIAEAADEQRKLHPGNSNSEAGVYLPLIAALISRTAKQDPAEQNWTPVEKLLEQAEKKMAGARNCCNCKCRCSRREIATTRP